MDLTFAEWSHLFSYAFHGSSKHYQPLMVPCKMSIFYVVHFLNVGYLEIDLSGYVLLL